MARVFSQTVPAPIGGWNARDPLELMPTTDAIRMDNVFPDLSNVRLRKGFRVHTTGGMGSDDVETLVEYAEQDGTRTLIAGANGALYDCTTFNTTATSLGSGFTVDQWQAAHMNNIIVLVNGTDQPQQYNGTTLSAANQTGIADDSVLITANSYKNRLYFVEKNSSSVWYGAVDSVTSALTEFDVHGVLNRGGEITFAGSWTGDAGAGLEDFLVIVSETGETLLYAGDNPGATNWGLVARYYLPEPLGRRAFTNMGSDLVIATKEGVVSLRETVGSAQALDTYAKVTDKINTAIRDAAIDYGSNFGWDVVLYPRGHYVFINIPIVANVTFHQYVMNTQTGAWCRFKGQNGISWSLLGDKLYFGGGDGKVYEADITDSDNAGNIDIDLKTAFNYFGDNTRKKIFTLAKPVFAGEDAVEFTFNIDTDFNERPVAGAVSIEGTSGTLWDSALWDTFLWANSDIYHNDWYGLSGDVGRSAALKLNGGFRTASFAISAFQVAYKQGGIL